MKKAWKPPSSRPISIYFEFRSKPSLITVVCMDPHSPKKLFATKYWFLILWDDTSFFFFISRFFFVCFCFSLLFYFIINVYKNYFINFFFSWKLFQFFHVPWCSGMFRHVRPECSVFRVLSTPNAEVFPASRSLSPPEWIYRGYYMAARGYTNFIFEWEILSAWDTFAKCLSQKCYETRI